MKQLLVRTHNRDALARAIAPMGGKVATVPDQAYGKAVYAVSCRSYQRTRQVQVFIERCELGEVVDEREVER
jgi:hypothetical protein